MTVIDLDAAIEAIESLWCHIDVARLEHHPAQAEMDALRAIPAVKPDLYAADRIRELEAEVARLTADRDAWRGLTMYAAGGSADETSDDDALERAAKVAESPDTPVFKDEWSAQMNAAAISTMMSVAAAIRALKGTAK